MGARIAKWEHRKRKQEQATDRKLACLKLTPEQRLDRLNARGLTATKERAKLIPLTERAKQIKLHSAIK